MQILLVLTLLAATAWGQTGVPGKIFIGGLPYTMDEADLRAALKKFGEVTDSFIVREREDERGVKKSKGYGFITFADPSDADEAIQAMHDTQLGGRKITVNYATKPSNGNGSSRTGTSSSGRGRGRGGYSQSSSNGAYGGVQSGSYGSSSQQGYGSSAPPPPATSYQQQASSYNGAYGSQGSSYGSQVDSYQGYASYQQQASSSNNGAYGNGAYGSSQGGSYGSSYGSPTDYSSQSGGYGSGYNSQNGGYGSSSNAMTTSSSDLPLVVNLLAVFGFSATLYGAVRHFTGK